MHCDGIAQIGKGAVRGNQLQLAFRDWLTRQEQFI